MNKIIVPANHLALYTGKEEEEKTPLNGAIELVSERGPQSRTLLVRPAVSALSARQSC